MKLIPSILVMALLASTSAFGADRIPLRIKAEFTRLRALVEKLEPEFVVGGYLKGKKYGDHELLWKLAGEPGEAEVIRIFRDKEGMKSFEITFHHNDHIVKGREVIRRFVGPGISGWRNDTIDSQTLEYLGSQGARRPMLDSRDREILKQWDIELFE